ncbi:MAG TPA: SURF1 family protein [Nocardioidaceae bacterium]|nr:SURF1 family protein [Nocardioidaceae bacterium]
MLRFLFTGRWLVLLLVVILVGFACVELGLWQFRRYEGKVEGNKVVRVNLVAEPVAVDNVMSTGDGPSDDVQWLRVRATGVYDPDHTTVILYRSRDGVPGVNVVVPLVTESGTALLDDRGWIKTSESGADASIDAPAPPTGTVTVTGWVRQNATGSSARVSDGEARSISSDEIGPTLGYPVYDGFVERTDEAPSASPAPVADDEPDLSTGPHFFYGVQWFFFAMLAVGFWVYFAYAEYQEQSGRRPRPPEPAARPAKTP